MKKLIFVIGFLLLFGNAYSQWFYQNNPDSISNVSSGSFINSNTGWYARSKGEISKTTDGGISWNTYKVDINDLNSIKFVNANTGYVCGNNGRLMKSTNGGLNWSWQNPNSSDTLVTIDFINELTGWCAGKDFIIFTTNGGSQWYRQNVDTNTVKPRFTVLKIYDSQSGLAGAFNKKNYTGDYAYIYRTSNGGVNWYFVDSVWRYRTYSICYINQNVVYLSTYMYLYKSINGGISWNVVSSLPNYSFYKNNIQFKNENNGWVLRNTCIYETINGGINWSNSILNGIDNFIDINLLPNGTIFASACKGAIYKTTNEGYCWGNYSINIESNLIGIKIFDENNIFLGGSETLCKSTNGGVNWQIKCRDSIYNLSEPVFLNYNTGFFLLNKNILKTTNCGENWYLVGETFPKPIHHMCCTDEYNFWVVGDSGMIMKSTNSGNSWVNKSIGDSLTLYRINVNNNNIFINTFGRLLKSTNAGNNWNWIDILLDTLYPFYNIYFINLQTGWLIPCDGIRFCKTFDGGNTWIKYYRQIENNLPTLRCFFVNENTGYAATSSCYYGLIKTTNSGINWSIVTSFPTNNYMTNNVSFLNENTGWVVGSQGLICKTTNAGTSFIAINNQNIPSKYILSQNYPNPFNPSTTIRFQIKDSRFVTLKVYDILGKKIATLVNEILNAGEYEIQFPNDQLTNVQLPSGVYFYSLFTDGNLIDTKKMLTIK